MTTFTDNGVGDISHPQVLKPMQLKDILLNSLHGEAGKQFGISKKMQELNQKHHFQSIASYVRKCVKNCQIYVQDKRFDNSQITPELISILEWDLGPEDVMQLDVLPEIPPSRGYGNIITAKDVLSRYAFADPVSNPTALTTAKVIINIMIKHAYLPTVMITDKGQFSSPM